MDEVAPYFRYWGKAQPSDAAQTPLHLLPFHCLDVAAVGRIYLQQSPALLQSCCALLKCSETAFLSWAAFLLALHDLGKFSEAFQAQRPELILALQQRMPHTNKTYKERHDSLGFWLWDGDLIEDQILQKIGIDDTSQAQRGLRCWLRAVTGHHGMPPKPVGNADFFFLKADKRAASDFVQVLAAQLLSDEAKAIPLHTGADFELYSELLSWWFAGVAVLADWLGSNTTFFPYHNQPQDLVPYWKYAQQQAEIALQHSGVLRSPRLWGLIGQIQQALGDVCASPTAAGIKLIATPGNCVRLQKLRGVKY